MPLTKTYSAGMTFLLRKEERQVWVYTGVVEYLKHYSGERLVYSQVETLKV